MRTAIICAALAAFAPALAHARSMQLTPLVDMGTSIPISVRVPPTVAQVDPAVRTQLESRLSRLLTGTGLAAVPGGANFVMYPSLVVLEERVVQSPRAMTVVKLDLSLFVKSVSDGVLFSSISKVIGGAGRSRNAALINAVSSLQGNDPDLRDFSQVARDRILDYYTQRCDAIIRDARTAAQTGDIDRAMASLLGVPDVVEDCHRDASQEAVDIFAAYQRQRCQSSIREARASLAVNDFAVTIRHVSNVDPGSSCAGEANQVIADLDIKVQTAEDREARQALEAERSRRAAIQPQLATREGAREHRESLMEAHASLYFNKQPPPAVDPSIYGNS